MAKFEVEWEIRGINMIPDAIDTEDAELRTREGLMEIYDVEDKDIRIVSFMELDEKENFIG